VTGTASEIEALRAALAATEARAVAAEAESARAQAVLSSGDAMIATLKLQIEKLRRALYGTRSERKARLLDQLELALEDLEATASEDELAAEAAARLAKGMVRSFERRRPARKPFPEHLSGGGRRPPAPARSAAPRAS
jgi:transposase